MPAVARMKGLVGGNDPQAVTSAAALEVDDSAGIVELTGTATVTSLNALGPTLWGRTLVLVQRGSGTTTFTNTNGAATKGAMDLGGTNVALGQDDVLVVYQRDDGSWCRITNTNN